MSIILHRRPGQVTRRAPLLPAIAVSLFLSLALAWPTPGLAGTVFVTKQDFGAGLMTYYRADAWPDTNNKTHGNIQAAIAIAGPSGTVVLDGGPEGSGIVYSKSGET